MQDGFSFVSSNVASERNDRSLALDEHGAYELLLSAARPDDWRGDWLETGSNATWLITRHYFENLLSAELDPTLRINVSIALRGADGADAVAAPPRCICG